MEKKPEYWRWSEVQWVNPDIPSWKGKTLTAGVDIGSTSTQCVIVADGEIYCYSSIRTGSNSPDSAVNAYNKAVEGTGITREDLSYIIGTGYGRVNVPYADKTVTEISCHARGANYIYGPSVRTVLDMGGQDCKAIHCDENGNVTSFLMNDKCAAGTGRGMEVISDLLAVPIEEIGARSLDVAEEPEAVTSVCVIFAKEEAVRKMRHGWTKEMVLAAYCRGMAVRVAGLMSREGIEGDFAITGGIAKNIGVVRRIEELLNVKAKEPRYDTQIAGALGAALIAQQFAARKAGKGQAGAAAGGMMAYFGYQDGSGSYYIKINTKHCLQCKTKACVAACPRSLIETAVNDFGGEAVQIKESKKRLLQAECDHCKLANPSNDSLPCHQACPFNAIEHTW